MKLKYGLILLQQIRSKPRMRKILVRVALVAGVFAVVLGGLVLWAGVRVASHVVEVARAPETQVKVERIQSEAAQVAGRFSFEQCWSKAMSLVDVQPWIDHSLVKNLESLRTSCFQSKPPQLSPTEGMNT